MRYHIGVKTVSESNYRGHWAERAKRARLQRGAAELLTRAEMNRTKWKPGEGRLSILLQRVGVKDLDDDNLAGSMKHVRDGIADALKINDGDKRLEWRYDQRRPRTDELIGVEVWIERREA